MPGPQSLPLSSERAHWAGQPLTGGHLAAAISSFGLHPGGFRPCSLTAPSGGRWYLGGTAAAISCRDAAVADCTVFDRRLV